MKIKHDRAKSARFKFEKGNNLIEKKLKELNLKIKLHQISDYAEQIYEINQIKMLENKFKDEELSYSYTANISGKKLIQNKNKLNVIALLINRTTGAIVNVAETSTIDDYTTGIEDIENSTKPAENAIYDLAGRKVQKAPKGIYIINGKKVAVN